MVNQIILTAGEYEAVILPECGGRVVSLRRKDKENALKAAPELWKSADCQIPHPSPFTPFTQYYGAETWIGPQEDWWLHQDLNEERLHSDVKWPPDPYVSYGRYMILNIGASAVTLVGEASPITGLRMKKRYELTSKGEGCRLRMETEVNNHRDEVCDFDIWHIVRVAGEKIVTSPVGSDADWAIEGPTHPYEIKAIGSAENGMFTFNNKAMREEYARAYAGTDKYVFTGKAFVRPSAPLIVSRDADGETELSISFEAYDYNLCPEREAPVEIYCYNDQTQRDETMYELEVHSQPYRMRMGETAAFGIDIRLRQE